MIIEQDQLLSDEKSIAEIMNNYFVHIWQGLDLKPPPSFEPVKSQYVFLWGSHKSSKK